MQAISSKLIKIVSANERINYYHFLFSENLPSPFLPGQFISVMMPSDPRPVPRPYSVASTPQEIKQGLLKLCVTAVPGGKVSNWLASLKEGDLMNFKGPFGKFVLPEKLPKNLHFISVGTGIAPFRSMILDLYDRQIEKQIYLYHGNRHEDSILYDEEFRQFANQHSNLHYFPCVSRPRNPENFQGSQGYVQQKVKEVLINPEECLVFICGINNMIDEVCEILAQRNFPKSLVHFERYD